MTIKEIAQMAGVSISTVSKIMNHKDASISAETRERVLRIAKEFNYSPYSNALSGNGKNFILGVLLSSCGNDLILKGILTAARELGYTVLTAESGQDPETEYKWLNTFCRHHVDAVLWEPVSAGSLTNADVLQSSDIPFLLFHTEESENACNIDFEQLGFQATHTLVQAQHRNIGCLLSQNKYEEGFLNGYRKCLFDYGIPFQDQLIFHEVNDALLQSVANRTVTGFVCSSYSYALRLCGNLRKRHYRIPSDISVISLRSDAEVPLDYPAVSAIPIPYLEFGKHLCRSIIGTLEHNGSPSSFVARTEPDSLYTVQLPFNYRARRLTVVGSINMDNYLKVAELPVTGKAVMTTNSSLYPGGKGINQSIGASKLGALVTLIGAVGDDMDSNLIFSAMDEYSIDSSCIRKCPDCSTGKAFIFVQPDGDSMISILSGANSLLTEKDILRNERVFEQSSYCLLQTEIPQETLLQAGKLAKAYGNTTILKPSACSHLNPELLKYVDIIVPNLNEVNILCPRKTLSEQADFFLNAGVTTVIITLGEDGCYLKTREEETFFPASDFTSVDNTGAGDAFICALAVYLQDGYPLNTSIRIATYAAGFSISREGVPPALIDRDTLESYIMQKEPGLLEL